MNDKAFEIIKSKQARLAQDVETAVSKKLTPLEELMEHRVTPDTILQPLEFLFRMNGTECFPLSELVANTGKAKSGKTLFLSIVMACCLKKNVLGLERISDNPIRVLWYDTEQSSQSTQHILVKRIIPLAETDSHLDDQFFVFNVRGMGWEKRRELLAVAIKEFKPQLVIVDGIKDLITDINDSTQATLVIEDQLGLAQANNCCIVDVLHQNKSDADRNMRGWIGTELTNKGFEVWACSTVPQTDTFKVEQLMSRMKRCDKNLYYRLDDDMLPVACGQPDEQTRDGKGRYASKKHDTEKTEKSVFKVEWAKLNRNYILPVEDQTLQEAENIPWDLPKLFADAMEGCTFKRFNQLMAVTMRISNIEDRKYYYHLLERAQAEHILAACTDGNGQHGFVINSSDLRQRIMAYEKEQQDKKAEAQQTLQFEENNDAAPF